MTYREMFMTNPFERKFSLWGTINNNILLVTITTEIVTDNGSQYKSQKFRTFSREWKVRHTFSSPRYPRSNGMTEKR